jgi:hypothetical protein
MFKSLLTAVFILTLVQGCTLKEIDKRVYEDITGQDREGNVLIMNSAKCDVIISNSYARKDDCMLSLGWKHTHNTYK